VGPGDYSQAAVFDVGVVDGDPQRRGEGGLESPVRRILMPGDILFAIIRRLSEEPGRDQNQIRTDGGLHDVKHARIGRQIPEWFENQVLLSRAGGDALGLAIGFEPVVDISILCRLTRAEQIDWGTESIRLKAALDLGRAHPASLFDKIAILSIITAEHTNPFKRVNENPHFRRNGMGSRQYYR
jgi:hypothetical protein